MKIRRTVVRLELFTNLGKELFSVFDTSFMLYFDEVLQEIGSQEIEVIRVSDEKGILRYITLDQIPGLVIDSWLASTREALNRETL